MDKEWEEQLQGFITTERDQSKGNRWAAYISTVCWNITVIFAAVHVKGIEIPNSNNMKTTVSPVSTQQKVKVYATTKVIFV